MIVHRKVSITASLALSLMAAGACTQEDAQDGAAIAGPSLTASIATVESGHTSDDELARIAREVIPGFAGWYVEDGQVVLRMTPGRDTSHAKARANALLDSLAVNASRRRVRQVRMAVHDYAQLKAWHEVIIEHFNHAALTVSYIDVLSNRVYVGLSAGASLENVRTGITSLGVPASALEVAHHAAIDYKPYMCAEGDPACTPIPAPDSTNTDFYVGADGAGTGLQAYYRPLVGGLLIRFHDNAMNWYSCTLGANVTRFGVAGFLTASHCAIREGDAYDGTEYTQGGNFYQIGYQRIDPPYTVPCNGGRIFCRYSDATFVYNNGTSAAYARLAEPQSKNGFGDVLSVANYQGYTVGYARRTPARMLLVGDSVAKVGAFTGYSVGRVEKTCLYAYGSTSGLMCQVLVRGARAQYGDSGAPVFSNWLSGTNVLLEGLLAGGDKNDPGVYLFSPWLQIEQELGNSNLVAW